MPDEKPPMDWVKVPGGVAEVYANSFHATWTKDDVRVRLAQVIDSPETPNPGSTFIGINEERAAVTFSWRNAKILRNQLAQIVEQYEKANGEIKVDVTLPEGT